MEVNFKLNQYADEKDKKSEFILHHLSALTEKHIKNCMAYRNIYNGLYRNKPLPHETILDIPYLPVQLFKNMELSSISSENVFKVLTSSGTTSQKVSKIFLDRETATYQSQALVAIVTAFIGKERLPMLIIDHPNVVKDRASFSARGAGILGFATFGKNHTYLLNENMELDFEVLHRFLEKYSGQKFLIFGFTFMVWQYFLQSCKKISKYFDLSQAVLLHGGGWKKLVDLNISNLDFKKALNQQFKIKNFHNYYGMVEQVGSIFMECSEGHLHAPLFADVIIRDPITLMPLDSNKQGLIQVISILPRSYPGHSLLTEDLGTQLGEDDCSCGLKGKYFIVHGRLEKSELRGCSDTHAAMVA